jgi:hypothetical protein
MLEEPADWNSLPLARIPRGHRIARWLTGFAGRFLTRKQQQPETHRASVGYPGTASSDSATSKCSDLSPLWSAATYRRCGSLRYSMSPADVDGLFQTHQQFRRDIVAPHCISDLIERESGDALQS